MFDLSPEKIMALLAVGLVVLGPHRLPGAARSLAQGLVKARRLADTLTQPVQASLAEPRQHIDRAVADLRDAVHGPAQTLHTDVSTGHPQAPNVEVSATRPTEESHDPSPRFDPAEN